MLVIAPKSSGQHLELQTTSATIKNLDRLRSVEWFPWLHIESICAHCNAHKHNTAIYAGCTFGLVSAAGATFCKGAYPSRACEACTVTCLSSCVWHMQRTHHSFCSILLLSSALCCCSECYIWTCNYFIKPLRHNTMLMQSMTSAPFLMSARSERSLFTLIIDSRIPSSRKGKASWISKEPLPSGTLTAYERLATSTSLRIAQWQWWQRKHSVRFLYHQSTRSRTCYTLWLFDNDYSLCW